MAHGPTLRAGTESSTFCLRTATTFERCRTRFGALRRTLPSSQRTSKLFLDRWFSSATPTGAPSSASRPNAPNVKALVYVDAFAPEAGESIQEELASAHPPPADFTIAVPFTTPTGGDADLYV